MRQICNIKIDTNCEYHLRLDCTIDVVFPVYLFFFSVNVRTK